MDVAMMTGYGASIKRCRTGHVWVDGKYVAARDLDGYRRTCGSLTAATGRMGVQDVPRGDTRPAGHEDADQARLEPATRSRRPKPSDKPTGE
jgi:hypothetical protein